MYLRNLKARVAQKEQLASAREISARRGLNGAANWLANQTRPDIAVQVSMSQQSFPKPLVKDILYANALGASIQRRKNQDKGN